MCQNCKGPSQQTQQQKACCAQNGLAQQRRREKRARARTSQGRAPTANAEAIATEDAIEDATEKESPNETVEKGGTYAAKVSPSVKIAESTRVGISMAPVAPKTSDLITTRATFPRAAEAFFQTKKTDVTHQTA